MDPIKPLPTGWMKLALRAQVCPQCHAEGDAVNPDPRSCEPACAYFVQLYRLARLLKRYGGKPPTGYEDFAVQLLRESATQAHSEASLDYAREALATLEKVAGLIEPPPLDVGGDCPQRDLAPGPVAGRFPRK